jgi:hypothetical protein
MNLQCLLVQNKSAILKRWYNFVLEDFSADTQAYLRKPQDRFDNPVAYEFRRGMEGIYEALLYGMDQDRVFSFLDRIISIRAIQDFPPSRAIAFIFMLKKAIREILGPEVRKNGITGQLVDRESRIDGLALLCFDIYMKRREKLYEVQVNEVKSRASGLLRRACLTSELKEENLKLRREGFSNREMRGKKN